MFLQRSRHTQPALHAASIPHLDSALTPCRKPAALTSPRVRSWSDRSQALWLLPLIAGGLPAAAALAAWLLSMRLDLIPVCNPFFDGCVSISRAARHELPNHIFRACVLPAAALQALT